MEVARVDDHHAGGEPESEADASDGAGDRGGQRELQVMHADFEVRVSEGFQHRDLAALRADEAREQYMQQKRDDAEKEPRQDQPIGAQFPEFVGEEPVGDLVVATVGAEGSVAVEQRVELRDDFGFAGAASECEGHVVERADHVERRREFVAAHPEDPVAAVIGKDFRRPDFVDVLGRQRDADDAQAFPFAVEDGVHRIADLQAVGGGKGFAGEDFTVAGGRLDVAPLAQVDVVEDGSTVRGGWQ